jgi:hypothetical protein
MLVFKNDGDKDNLCQRATGKTRHKKTLQKF